MATDVEEFLEHYGKKGMRWGQRHALNKASRSKDRAARVKDIDRARDRFESGKARKDYKKAKAKYKQDKHVIGSREARKALNKVKEKNINDYNTSIQYKNGKEVAQGVLVTAGVLLVGSLLKRT